jgi:hypothetical protein
MLGYVLLALLWTELGRADRIYSRAEWCSGGICTEAAISSR